MNTSDQRLSLRFLPTFHATKDQSICQLYSLISDSYYIRTSFKYKNPSYTLKCTKIKIQKQPPATCLVRVTPILIPLALTPPHVNSLLIPAFLERDCCKNDREENICQSQPIDWPLMKGLEFEASWLVGNIYVPACMLTIIMIL